jgi:hypothetical protein
MKTTIFVLAMLLTAATAYNQTSRKPANNNNTATQTKERKVVTPRNTNPGVNQRQDHPVSHQRSVPTTSTTTTTTRTVQTAAQKPPSRESSPSRQNNNTAKNPGRESRYHATNNTTYHPVNNPTGVTHPRVVEYTSPRVYREPHRVVHYYHTPPPSREYRSIHYLYRRPVNLEIYWTPVMYRRFLNIYPMVTYWNYYDGYRIEMISAYDATYYRGNVMTVYGQVSEVYYARETDEYFLYFGAYYPYQDFTVIIPGSLARSYSHRPDRFFDNQFMAVTGLITTFNGEPEIVVRENFQINLY